MSAGFQTHNGIDAVHIHVIGGSLAQISPRVWPGEQALVLTCVDDPTKWRAWRQPTELADGITGDLTQITAPVSTAVLLDWLTSALEWRASIPTRHAAVTISYSVAGEQNGWATQSAALASLLRLL